MEHKNWLLKMKFLCTCEFYDWIKDFWVLGHTLLYVLLFEDNNYALLCVLKTLASLWICCQFLKTDDKSYSSRSWKCSWLWAAEVNTVTMMLHYYYSSSNFRTYRSIFIYDTSFEFFIMRIATFSYRVFIWKRLKMNTKRRFEKNLLTFCSVYSLFFYIWLNARLG